MENIQAKQCEAVTESRDVTCIDIVDALEFWAGTTPDNKDSAGRTQSGSITKAGSATHTEMNPLLVLAYFQIFILVSPCCMA